MKIRITNTKYYQNGDTIVCKIDVRYDYSNNSSYLYSSLEQNKWEVIDGLSVDYDFEVFKKSFVGKAKLQEGDIFDEKLGKRIAESKAKLKAFQFLVKITNRIEDEEHKKHRSISELANKAIGLVHQELLHLDKLIEG